VIRSPFPDHLLSTLREIRSKKGIGIKSLVKNLNLILQSKLISKTLLKAEILISIIENLSPIIYITIISKIKELKTIRKFLNINQFRANQSLRIVMIQSLFTLTAAHTKPKPATPSLTLAAKIYLPEPALPVKVLHEVRLKQHLQDLINPKASNYPNQS